MMVKVLLIILLVIICLFLLSLMIYFFNLDMKLAAAMIPIMNKIYDKGKIKRKKKADTAAGKANGTSMDNNGSEAKSI